MLIALFFLLLYWIVGTWGAAFWVTHITDPTTYGPARGQERGAQRCELFVLHEDQQLSV